MKGFLRSKLILSLVSFLMIARNLNTVSGAVVTTVADQDASRLKAASESLPGIQTITRAEDVFTSDIEPLRLECEDFVYSIRTGARPRNTTRLNRKSSQLLVMYLRTCTFFLVPGHRHLSVNLQERSSW